MGRSWSERENHRIVEDYFMMLLEEARGNPYVKAGHRRQLSPKLNDRSAGAIEYKHQNISAVLLELGLPYIEGYKPATNYQESLRDVVEAYLHQHQEVVGHLLDAAQHSVPDEEAITGIQEVSPPEPLEASSPVQNHAISTGPQKYHYAEAEQANRRLGRMGEQAVLTYERQCLSSQGRWDLAGKVRWIAEEEGDGAGYDILSFDPRGEERFIEVKTTKHGIRFPFYLTANELRVSVEQAEKYALYRLFSFRKAPKLFRRKGDVRSWTDLQPAQYRAYIR